MKIKKTDATFESQGNTTSEVPGGPEGKGTVQPPAVKSRISRQVSFNLDDGGITESKDSEVNNDNEESEAESFDDDDTEAEEDEDDEIEDRERADSIRRSSCPASFESDSPLTEQSREFYSLNPQLPAIAEVQEDDSDSWL